MVNKIKALLGMAHREDATSTEVTSSLPHAEAELAAAQAAQVAADGSYKASLLSGDEAEMYRLATARREAAVRVDRGEALVEVLRGRLDGARAREAEADRVERYEAARRQGDEAADALREFYPQYAGGLVELLKAVAEAELAVKEANADLPAKAVPLPGVEARVRDHPGLPEEVVQEVEVEKWVRTGMTVPGTYDQAAVRPTEGGRGVLRVRGLPDNEGYPVERRKFIERTVLPAAFSLGADRLVYDVSLPGLREGEASFFEPVKRPYQTGFDHREVLLQVAKLRGTAPRGEPTRAVVTKLIPLDEKPVKSLS